MRNAGLIQIESLEGTFQISKLRVALQYFQTWLASHRTQRQPQVDHISIPYAVKREFGRMIAVKVIGWIDQDGYPRAAPMLSLQPANEGAFVGQLNASQSAKPDSGAQVAANILTFEAISYQAKGVWQSNGKTGKLYVQEIFAGGPPYPGGRVA